MKLLISLIFIFVFSLEVQSQDYNSIQKLNTINKKSISRSQILNIVSDSVGDLDTIELKNGAILYGGEIDSITYEINRHPIELPRKLLRLPPAGTFNLPLHYPAESNHILNMDRVVGGDGSGGG